MALVKNGEEAEFERRLVDAVETVLRGHGGIIYGGFVRDSIVRRHEVKKAKEADRVVCERLLLPVDIDCFVREQRVKPLMEALRIKFAVFEFEPKGSARDYFLRSCGGEQPGLKLVKLQVRHLIHPCLGIDPCDLGTARVDLVISDGSHSLPLTPIDFECNGLMIAHGCIVPMDERGGRRASDKYDEMKERIVRDVEAKRAVCISVEVAEHRVRKMLKKEWTLVARNFSITPMNAALPSACACAGCTGGDACGECECGVITSCCSAPFHLSCFNIKATACPQCSQEWLKWTLDRHLFSVVKEFMEERAKMREGVPSAESSPDEDGEQNQDTGTA